MINSFIPKLLAALTLHLQKAAIQSAALPLQQQQTVAQAQLAIQQGNANKPFQNYPIVFINIEIDKKISPFDKQYQTVLYKLNSCESEKEIPHTQISFKLFFCKEHKMYCRMIERTAYQAPASAPCEVEFQLLQHLPTQNTHPQKADKVTAIIGLPLEFQATVKGLQTVTCLDTGAGLNAIS